MMDEALALYSSLSCCGFPRDLGLLGCHSYVRMKDKEVHSEALCLWVVTGRIWLVTIRAGAGLAILLWDSEMPGCWSFLYSGALLTTLAASVLEMRFPPQLPSHLLSSLPLLSPLFLSPLSRLHSNLASGLKAWLQAILSTEVGEELSVSFTVLYTDFELISYFVLSSPTLSAVSKS